MISETLSVGLEKYQIGPKLRRLRLRKKLGLTELGRHTGLSAGMLSKIERGLLFPTLPTLLRIALVFNTGLEHFFSNEEAGPQIAVVRKNQRLKFPNPPGGKPPAYFFESLDFPITGSKIAAFYAEFTSDRLVSDPHSHEGAELIYQLRGKLRVIVGDEHTVLSSGDAMYFDSGAPHSYAECPVEKGGSSTVNVGRASPAGQLDSNDNRLFFDGRESRLSFLAAYREISDDLTLLWLIP